MMNPRLYKEYRALSPFWAAALLLPLAPFLLRPLNLVEATDDLCYLGYLGYALGCGLLGTASFGVEWNHQTMEMLLAQPLPRHRIWREKIRALAPLLATVCLWFLLFHLFMGIPGFFARPAGWFWIVFPVLWALGVGPLFALQNANAIVALVCTLLTPAAWVAFMALLLPAGWDQSDTAAGYAFCAFGVPLVILAGAGYQLARWHFHHLDTSRVHSPAIHGFDWLFRSAAFPGMANALPAGSLARLVRKEFRLQEVSYLIAGVTLLLTVVVVVGRQLYAWYSVIIGGGVYSSRMGFVIGMVLMAVNGVLVTLIAGSVAVAEERQIGVLDWHLTLPPTHFRQWLTKLLVAEGHTLALGFLLPILTSMGLCWLSQRGPDPIEFKMDYLDLLGLGAASLLVTLVSFFASSLMKTSLRAILLNLGVLGLAALIGGAWSRLLAWNLGYLAYWEIPGLISLGMTKYWILIVVAVASLWAILYLSYANYRRLETRFGFLPQILVVSLAAYVLFASPFYYSYFKDQDRQIRGLASEVDLRVRDAVALDRPPCLVSPSHVLILVIDRPRTRRFLSLSSVF